MYVVKKVLLGYDTHDSTTLLLAWVEDEECLHRRIVLSNQANQESSIVCRMRRVVSRLEKKCVRMRWQVDATHSLSTLNSSSSLGWNESPNFTDLWQRQARQLPHENADALCVPRESSARRARRRNPLHLDCSENRTTFNPGNIGSLYGHIFHIYTPLSDSLGISKVPDINMFGLKRIFILTSRDFTGAFSLP